MTWVVWPLRCLNVGHTLVGVWGRKVCKDGFTGCVLTSVAPRGMVGR